MGVGGEGTVGDMKAFMDRDRHHAHVQRALELGRTENPTHLGELIALLRS